ncbi:MAG: hypothetical protein ACKO8G_06425, partial [Actinomycetota bacterium]
GGEVWVCFFCVLWGGGGEGLVLAPPPPPPPFPVPEGFVVADSFADAYPDRIATRSTLEDDRGRTLTRFAGLEGEFGEGLPLADDAVALASGGTARLLGSQRVWALVWRTDGPCGAKAAFAGGFRRGAFLRVLREMGVLA